MEEQQQEKKPTRPASEIAKDIIKCTKCPLHTTRKNAVPGAGPDNAEIIILGEGPGDNEDRQGLPFVGASGNDLDKLLDKAGINRRDVFITNTIKCRAPSNRNPTKEETLACRPWLEEQLESLDPKMIITLGNPATQWFMPDTMITKVRGKIYNQAPNQILIPTIHPAGAMRKHGYTKLIEEDFELISFITKVMQTDPDKPNPFEQEMLEQKSSSSNKAAKEKTVVPDIELEPQEVGPILAISDWMYTNIKRMGTLEENQDDIRRNRHGLKVMSKITAAIMKHADKYPDGPYGNLIEKRIKGTVEEGEVISSIIPHICGVCHNEFYATNQENKPEPNCTSCE